MSGKHVQLRYEGRVQGVGFRFTAVNIARELGVTGYVRNEPDGSVLVEAEGPEDQLKAFQRRIHSSPPGRHIRDEHAVWSEPAGEYKEFNVRF